MSAICDPRVSFENCPNDWQHSLQTFYYAACIWSTAVMVTTVAHFIVDTSRKGWGGQPQFLLSFIPLGSLAMCGYCFGMAFSNGKMNLFASEFLWTFPIVILAFSQFYLSTLLSFLNSIKVSELMDPKKMYRTVLWLSIGMGMFSLFGAIAASVMLYYKREWSRWTFLLGGGTSCLVFAVFAVGMVWNLKKLRTNLSTRVSKRIESTLIKLSAFAFVWILFFVIRCIVYDYVLQHHSVGGWMFLQAVHIFVLTFSMAVFAGALAKEEFTTRGIKKLKAKVVVTMEKGTKKGAEIEVVDKSALETLTKSGPNSKAEKSSASTDSGEQLPECSSGICRPIIDVDIAVARELAQPIWKRPPKSFKDLFTFPHPVNEIESRIHAGFATCLAATILILGAVRPDLEAWWLYIYLVFGFLARFLSGPRFDPQAWLVVLVISPLLKFKPVYVPGPPKRFAQFCGVMVSTISLILYCVHQREAAFWALSILLVLSIVQGIFGICVGCFVWHVMCMTGFMGESITIKSTSEFRVKKKGTSSSPASKREEAMSNSTDSSV